MDIKLNYFIDLTHFVSECQIKIISYKMIGYLIKLHQNLVVLTEFCNLGFLYFSYLFLSIIDT